MMRTPQLKGYSRARVWLDETPAQAAMHGALIGLHTEAGGPSSATRKSVALEWHIPLGPRSLYGLLGVEFQPLDGVLRIELVDEAPHRECEDSLTSRVSDKALVGLGEEYQAAVVKGILAAATKDGARLSGRLLINAAVIGEVNSCEAIFENLGRVVTALLCTSGELPDSELQSLIVYHQTPATPPDSPQQAPRG
jgi:hypothetical protein